MSRRREEISPTGLSGGEKQREEKRERKRGRRRKREGKEEIGRSGSFSL